MSETPIQYEELGSNAEDCNRAFEYLHGRMIELKNLVTAGHDEYRGSIERIFYVLVRLVAYAKEATQTDPVEYQKRFTGQPEHDEFVLHVEDFIEMGEVDVEGALEKAGELDMKVYDELYNIKGDKVAAAFVKIINDGLTRIDEEYEFFVGNVTPLLNEFRSSVRDAVAAFFDSASPELQEKMRVKLKRTPYETY